MKKRNLKLLKLNKQFISKINENQLSKIIGADGTSRCPSIRVKCANTDIRLTNCL
ncbi:hypothetical protein [uncultured Kordia sp.]|uniref:hypothetical protein n=1 Tax=uncultured Kordia sp. TaxID=507699 RepID=UPI00260B5534|nr:hypothetical protein [uncultured Kordia sp.]